MCGITGLLPLTHPHPIDRSLLERMNAAITHRGPDSDGFYVNENVGLGVRRLAIIDLKTGDQPISNETGEICIVFNGEIYNFPELRPALERKGHLFRTHTDTEAILHLYEEYGPACVQHLRGMFAFAIWDGRARRLFLARDRVGKKPLYYTLHDGVFYFGSELACLLQIPTLPRRPNLPALHHYLTLMYVPDPWTAFEGLYKLPPAHTLTLSLDHFSQNPVHEISPPVPYWDLSYEPKLDLPEPEIRQQLRTEITTAVRIRLLSDVPLGAHLSGGLDSSIIVGLMARLLPHPVQTFSIGFTEENFNETPFARQVAKKFNTDHHEFILQPNALEALPRMIEHFGEPFADPAALPTWYLAQMTRQHVTVALNGDGGDEAFAGYQRYFGDRYVDLYRAIPAPLRRGVLNPLIFALPSQADRPYEQSYTAALRGLARGAEIPHTASKVRWSTHFSAAEKWDLYNPDMRAAVHGHDTTSLSAATFHAALTEGRARHRIDCTLYTDLHHYLPGALLPKVDRMTMAHSLEARSPFLDHKVLELAARLPAHWKVRGQTTKWILRDLFKDLLPPGLEKRGKKGFSVPLGAWFAGPLYGPAREWLCAPNARLNAYLRPEAVSRLLEENKAGKENHGKRIWTLLNWELWMRRFLG